MEVYLDLRRIYFLYGQARRANLLVLVLILSAAPRATGRRGAARGGGARSQIYKYSTSALED